MHEEIIFAGFGGQGVLFAAQLLAYAGMMQGKQVAWIPSYGPEMRGGTAAAATIISDEKIGSLSVSEPSVVAVMNTPSLDKYENWVRPGGILAINRSLIRRPVNRTDITLVEVNANDLAVEMGNDRLASIIMLGTVVAATGAIPVEAIDAALAKVLTGRKAAMLDENQSAVRKGMTCGAVKV